MTQELYFKRQIELWGADKQSLLESKRVAIIGAGGLGSTLALALGTSGIGEIDIVDFDTVSIHNIHRQIAFTLDDNGKNKAQAVANLLRAKNPFVTVRAYESDFESFAKSHQQYDLILDATDNLPTRAQIDRYAKEIDTPWIYASVEAFNGQVCFMDRSSFDVINTTDKKPAGIAAPMVMHIGSLEANMAIRHLIGLPIPKDTLHYLYYNQQGELITQKFGMPVE